MAAAACDVTAVVNGYCHSLLTITVMMRRDHQPGQGRQAGRAALGPVTIGRGRYNREWKRDGVSSKSGKLELHACLSGCSWASRPDGLATSVE